MSGPLRSASILGKATCANWTMASGRSVRLDCRPTDVSVAAVNDKGEVLDVPFKPGMMGTPQRAGPPYGLPAQATPERGGSILDADRGSILNAD
jgi:hypothetical protein